jgi:hypothetical protein
MSILAAARGGHVLMQLNHGGELIDVNALLDRIHGDLHPGQLAFVADHQTQIIGVSAGYGAGKTRALCAKAVTLAAANQGFIGCVMEPTGPLIRDIWQNDFEQFLESYDVPYTFRASPLPEYMLHLPGGDTKILCRSFENWSRIIGLNLAWVLADEIDTVAPSIADKAFPKILGRLRSGNVRQFGAASTPEGFRWLWNTFASDDAKTRTDRKLIKMRTADNPHLPPDFIERLEANYDPKLLKSYLLGEFINLTTGCVYDRFDRSKHIYTKQLDISEEALRVGIDFNIGNTNAVIGVRIGDRAVVVDEITGMHKIYGYPDASGGNRSTNATRTDIQILESYGISNQSPQSNPPIRDRVNNVQAMLENGKGKNRLQIWQGCTKLIECLELQCWDEKTQLPDKASGFDHVVDCLGYWLHRDFSMLHKQAGRGTGVRLY